MKKNLLLIFLFSCSVFAQAQMTHTCSQEIKFYDDCNRSWMYNNSRFFQLIWTGMMKGEIKIYSFDTPYSSGKPQQYSFSELYHEYMKAKQRELENMDLFDQPQIALLNRQDSISALLPVTMNIYYKREFKATDSLENRKEWIQLGVPLYDEDFGYTLSYTEVKEVLDKSKSYWVNPYQAGDSVLFSQALKEERYVFNWINDSAPCDFHDANLYKSNFLKNNNYKFTGNITRYANLNDIANQSFFQKWSDRNIFTILINAFFNGEIKAYDPAGNELTTESYREEVIKQYATEDYYLDESEGMIYDWSYTAYSENLDMISVSYHVELDESGTLNKEEPYRLTLCSGPESNYRGVVMPLVSFDFKEAMNVLSSSGFKWYANDNHADSCTLAEAIRYNRLFWNKTIVCDGNDGYIYGCDYNKDSVKFYTSEEADQMCIKNVILHTQENIKRSMHTAWANSYVPSHPSLPLYLHYTGFGYLNKEGDSTSIFQRKLSEYLVKKSLQGKLTAYKTDSLTIKLSKEQVVSRMIQTTVSEDELANRIETQDTLKPDDFDALLIQSDLTVNAKGQLKIKDLSLQPRIPAEFSPIGLELPFVSYSYNEVVVLMKSDKEGKVLLKQLDLVLKQKKYVVIYGPAGDELYNIGSDTDKQTQMKRLHPSLHPYLK